MNEKKMLTSKMGKKGNTLIQHSKQQLKPLINMMKEKQSIKE